MEYLKNFLKGILVGVANVIPGVSGGTMAIVTGVYEKIIEIVGNAFSYLKDWKKMKQALMFVIPLGLGGVVGIIGFSKAIKFLLANANMQLMFCFLGFVAGSFPFLFKSANKNGFKKRYLIPFFITVVVMIGIVLLKKFDLVVPAVTFGKTFLDVIKLIAYGFIAAATMIIPGVSGSMVMMILGIYESIISAVSSLDLFVLIPFALGVGLGILLISKAIKVLLDKFYGYTYYAILGFVIGSIIFLFPGVEFSLKFLLSILIAVVSFVISYKITQHEDGSNDDLTFKKIKEKVDKKFKKIK